MLGQAKFKCICRRKTGAIVLFSLLFGICETDIFRVKNYKNRTAKTEAQNTKTPKPQGFRAFYDIIVSDK